MTHVRPAVVGDLPAIRKILTECDLVADQNLENFTGITLVAVRDGEVVGFAQALPGRPLAYWSMLAVLPAYRHTMAGAKLSEGIELLLRAAGSVEWAAFAHADNEKWIETLEAWGAEKHSRLGYLMRKSLVKEQS